MPERHFPSHSGPAPEPKRHMSLGYGVQGGAAVVTSDGNIRPENTVAYTEPNGAMRVLSPDEIANVMGGVNVTNGDLPDVDQIQHEEELAAQVAATAPEPAPAPAYEATPAPPDPEMAAQLLSLQGTINQLLEEVRSQRSANDELQFQLDAFQRYGGNPFGHAPAAAPQGPPPGVDPAATVTYGDLQLVAQKLLEFAPAQALRTIWDVTPEEEARVLGKYPQANSLAEPQRTQFVHKAALRMRASSAPATTPAPVVAAPAPQAPALPTPPVPRASRPQSPPRPAPKQVPLVETSGPAPSTAEPQLTNPLREAILEYERARSLRGNAKARSEAMKAAADKIARLQGMRDRGGFINGSFSQRSR